MAWEIQLHPEVTAWFLELVQEDPDSADLVEHAIDLLAEEGPSLGRPLADRIKGSRIHNMKELRPASTGTSEVRILFVFDPRRCAALLVAGNKEGQWEKWYRKAIPLAEERYEAHTAAAEVDDG
ncbi:type II toxin-antitoxin system RelE/ParE family toxin [Amycolatopsis sp. CA-230715]|uniref:type II toxin-antitoxin system RelE/ParE family toxin n=1 Tax=Amycolatopsis sp. CA-230715 TaxID=2745196 RepID=UPI001C02CD2F|nr:type II toxin-antitoxin system RelE/ParE family toxin [Amycolatopsis sp. CA-230715]QWF80081.1 Putative toxin HigB2 [Amycolatopsis sp. CA-230715]